MRVLCWVSLGSAADDTPGWCGCFDDAVGVTAHAFFGPKCSTGTTGLAYGDTGETQIHAAEAAALDAYRQPWNGFTTPVDACTLSDK